MDSKLTKRMPYNVPDHFFDELEAGVWNEIRTSAETQTTDNAGRQLATPTAGTRKRRPTVALTLLAAAASLLLLFTLPHRQAVKAVPADSMEHIDKAFARLSGADQDYLLEVYGDAVFADSEAGDY
ncbi:MAG: hypothetical protein PUC81_08660 [Prevotellaceae bacterium]|nr:hypothetical protein [Prevotellaceae bacterium]